MPKLPQYESPTASRGLQPSDRGIAAVEQEGRAWNTAFHQLGDVAQTAGNVLEKHYAQKDAADLAKQGADAFATLTQNWNQTATGSDPNDPNVAENWRQNALEPVLEKIGADVSSKHGEEAAQRLRDSLRMHFTEKSVADQSTLSGLAVQSNLEQATNSLGNAVRADPSSLPAAIGILDSAITSQVKSHGLDAVTATKIRTELFNKASNGIAQSALFGLAESNPEAAQKALDAGAFDKYFSPSQMQASRSYVEQQSKTVTALVKTQNKEASDGEMASIQNSTIGPDGQLTISRDYFSKVAAWAEKWQNKPGAGETVAEKSRALIQFGRSITEELEKGIPAVDDPHTYEDFRARIGLQQGDPNALTELEVIQARADGKLSDKSFSFYKGAVTALAKDPALRSAQREFNTFLKGIKSSITNSNILMGTNDPTGDKQYLAFTQDAQAQFDSAYQKNDGGASWRALLDRSNKNSLWQQSVRYQTSQKGAMQGLQDRVQGSSNFIPAPAAKAPARMANESPAAYLARTGGK